MNFGQILDSWEKTNKVDFEKDDDYLEPIEQKAKTSKKRKAKNLSVKRGEIEFDDYKTPEPDFSKIVDAQSKWLEIYGVSEDNIKDADDSQIMRMTNKDIEKMPIDAKLDLHGMTQTEAENALETFFTDAEKKHCRKILIIHGKGLHSDEEPVLSRLVKRWLENRASAGKSGHPDSSQGGSGVTWVLLKNENQRSR